MQTQSAIQSARSTLGAVSGDIRQTYARLQQTGDDLEKRRGCGADLRDLLFGGVAKGVSAEGDDDAIGILDSGHWSLLTVPLASRQRAHHGTRVPYTLSVWVAPKVDQYKWV